MYKNLIDNIEEYYKSRIPNKVTDADNYVYASVAVIFNNDYEILFIKRPDNPEDPYSGHVAFPGGKFKNEDKELLYTALREVDEEVGIDLKKNGKIVAELDQLRPLNPQGPKFIVAPYLAMLIKDTDIVLNEEVEKYFWIPLDHFLDARPRKFPAGILQTVGHDDKNDQAGPILLVHLG